LRLLEHLRILYARQIVGDRRHAIEGKPALIARERVLGVIVCIESSIRRSKA
jgi:hypothetical protein